MHLKLTHSILCQVYVNLEEGDGEENGRDHAPRTNFGEERRKRRPKTGRTTQKALQNPYKRE